MKELFRVPVDEGVCTYLQMLVYTMEGLRVLNCQIIRSGKADNAIYTDFLGRYQDAFATYNVAFDELCRELAPHHLAPKYRRELSFLTGELIVSEGASA